MSSFSSVVQKPGKKFAPKAVPRRNVPRKPSASSTGAVVPTTLEEHDTDQNERSFIEPALTGSTGIQNERNVCHSVDSATVTSTLNEAIATEDTAARITTEVLSPSEVITSTELPDETNSIPVELPATNGRLNAEEELVVPPSTAEHAAVSPDESTQTLTQDESLPGVGSTGATQDQEEDEEEAAANAVESPVLRSSKRKKTLGQETKASSPRKRRKTTPRAIPRDGSPQSVSANPSTGASIADESPSQQHHRRNQPTDDLLLSATRRAASVSELASDIESQTLMLRPQIEQSTTATNQPESMEDGETPSSIIASKPKRTKRKKNIQEQAAQVVASALGKSSVSVRQRADTPENAENHELEPAKVTMGELCEDNKLGKKSSLEAEMQENWAEILQRRKEDKERALLNAEKYRRKGVGQHNRILDNTQEPAAVLAPAMTVVNGVIVVDQASREVDRSAQLQQAAVQDFDNIREDRDYYKYVNQGTVGVKPGRGQHSKWDEEANERFFRGLRMFGTDFLMIANMFPGFSRKQIKMKFIREENADKARVLDCLRNREPVQLEEYASMANTEAEEYHTLDSLQQELDEQEKKLREEDNERRKKEGYIPTAHEENDARQPELAGNEGGDESQTASVEPGRFDSVAREIVGAAIAPKKRTRKANTTTGKRGLKVNRRLEGGVEEVLGSIHDIAV